MAFKLLRSTLLKRKTNEDKHSVFPEVTMKLLNFPEEYYVSHVEKLALKRIK